MALENIAEIESSLGIEAGKLKEMIASEESHTIDLSTRIILDKPTYEERIANIKKESATTAIEMAVKEQRNTLGLEFTGKTMENLVTAIKSKVESEATVAPEEKYKALKTDFEKLQSNYTEKESEFTNFKTNIEKQNQLSEIKNDFTKHIPANTLVSKATIFTEAKEKGFSFEKEEGKTVVKDASGNIIKDDKTYAPIDLAVWVVNFSAPYVAKAAGGNGGGDDVPAGKAGSFEAFEKEAQKAGWNDSQKNEEMAKRVRDKTLVL